MVCDDAEGSILKSGLHLGAPAVSPGLKIETVKALSARVLGEVIDVYTDAHLLCLQYNWLQADLAKVDRTQTPFIIALSHPPVSDHL